MKKKIEKNRPKNRNSIIYYVYNLLKKGVSCREELILKTFEELKNNNVDKNFRGKQISIRSIINNINENTRYIREARRGWYQYYELISNNKELKIIKKTRTFERIPIFKRDDNHGNNENKEC